MSAGINEALDRTAEALGAMSDRVDALETNVLGGNAGEEIKEIVYTELSGIRAELSAIGETLTSIAKTL